MKLLNKILINSVVASMFLSATGWGLQIENIRTDDQKARDYLSNALLAGKYVEVQREKDSVNLQITSEPSLTLNERERLKAQAWRDYVSPQRYTEWTYLQSKEWMENQRHDNNLIAIGSLLKEWLIRFPEDENLMKAADRFVSTLQNKSGWSFHAFVDLEPTRAEVLNAIAAVRTGLPVETFANYPEFQKFLDANRLDRLTAYFDHKLEIKTNGWFSSDYEPKLLVNGQEITWTELLTGKEKDGLPPLLLDEESRLMNYVYTQQGLTPIKKGDLPVFYKTEEPYYGKEYVLEVASSYVNGKDIPDTWVRLKDPSGNVYSAGWVPGTSNGWVMSGTPGKFLAPFETEFVDQERIVTTPLLMTSNQFEVAMQWLKEIQNDPAKACFGTGSNDTCGGFVQTLLEELGLPGPVLKQGWVVQVTGYETFQNAHTSSQELYEWQNEINQWRINFKKANGSYVEDPTSYDPDDLMYPVLES